MREEIAKYLANAWVENAWKILENIGKCLDNYGQYWKMLVKLYENV